MSEHIEREIDFLDGAEKSNVPLLATCIGFKKSFQERLGISKFPMVMHDEPRKAVKKLYKSSNYPYGYFRLSNLVLDEEKALSQNIRRMGSGHSMADLENVMIEKQFMWRSVVSIEGKYLDNDITRVIDFVTKFAIINACRLLSFDIKLPNGAEWNVDVRSDTNGAAIPQPSEEDEAKAGVYEIDFSFTLSSKIGMSKSVAKINNEGKITTNVGTINE